MGASTMNAQHYALLEDVIEGWYDDVCARSDWPPVITGSRTVEFMATAARSVFDAMCESQEYGKREGFFKDVE